MSQILLHLWGDYLTQSDWMAQNKTKAHIPALIHAVVYGLPFLLIGSWFAVAVIIGTHFLIDRYRLARFVVWAKNWLGPKRQVCIEKTAHYETSTHCRNAPFSACSATGYAPDSPPWLAFWLLIIADNTLHLTINYLALRYM